MKNLHLFSFNQLSTSIARLIHDKSLDTRPHFPSCVNIAEGGNAGIQTDRSAKS